MPAFLSNLSATPAVNRIAAAARSVRRAFGYDGAEDKKRRKAPSPLLRSEDDELPAPKRAKLVSGARDITRNFALAGWVIRKHLDFVSEYSFQSRTGNSELDDELESLVEWAGRPANFDVSGRYGRRDFVRIAEEHSLLDGDIFLLKVPSRGQVQGIEGDRVRDPGPGWDGAAILPVTAALDAPRWVQGVKIGLDGRPLAYSFHRRNGTGFVFERDVRAGLVWQHGHFRRFDQVRGISPLAAALNTFRDVYEGIDYALAKAKIAQLFGLVLFRGDTNSIGAEAETGEYEIDFSNGAPILDLDPGDRAEFLENKTPSGEFREFVITVIALALKSLDIPYSFYDESWTNFFGSKAAQQLYVKSCEPKRRRVQSLLDNWTRWRLNLLIADGTFDLGRYGVESVADLKFQWVPSGLPWFDKSREVLGDIMAMSAGLQSHFDIMGERNGGTRDPFQVIDEIAEVFAHAKKKGVPLSFGPYANSVEATLTEETAGHGGAKGGGNADG